MELLCSVFNSTYASNTEIEKDMTLYLWQIYDIIFFRATEAVL